MKSRRQHRERGKTFRAPGVTTFVLAGVLTLASAAPAQAASATGRVHTAGADLAVRGGPSSNVRTLGNLHNGATVSIICQTAGTREKGTYGTSRLWDKLATGGYVSDAFIYTGSDGRVAPDCSPSTGPSRRNLPRTLSMSSKGRTFLTTFEGLRLRPYNDSNGFCTVGVGHLLHRSTCTSGDHTITKTQADKLLASDVRRLSAGVAAVLPKTPMYQYEFDAMVSFAFNVGVGRIGGNSRFTSSKVWEDLAKSKPDYRAVPAHLLNWTKHPCGAHSRRINEGRLFATGSYQITSHCG